jgi:hypothetical protein
MNTIRWILPFVLLLSALSACNLPQQNPATPSSEEVATAVNQILTSIPSSTVVVLPTTPPVDASPTPPPTATVEPTIEDTEEPTTTPTAEPVEPTATVSPSATTAPQDPRSSLGEPSGSDTFDGETSFLEYSDEHVQFDVSSGFLNATALKADGWHGWTMSGGVLKDAYLETTVGTSTCSNLDRYGILFRSPDPTQGYFFGLSCDGRYSLRLWDGDSFTPLVDWKTSTAILSGVDHTNRLGVMMEGDTLSLYINGTRVDQIADSTYDEGRYGLFVAASATPEFTARFDRVDHWTLP